MTRIKNPIVILIICMTILACTAIVGWGNRGQASSKAVWEYKIVSIPMQGEGSGGQPERTMNELGADGWELVQIISNDEITGYQGYFLFKRAK